MALDASFTNAAARTAEPDAAYTGAGSNQGRITSNPSSVGLDTKLSDPLSEGNSPNQSRRNAESSDDDGALNNGRHHVHMHADDAAPHPFWTLLLLYRLLWPALWPVLIAAAGVIAMILRAGW